MAQLRDERIQTGLTIYMRPDSEQVQCPKQTRLGLYSGEDVKDGLLQKQFAKYY